MTPHDVTPEGRLLSDAEILDILARVEAGEDISLIFNPGLTKYPRFAYAEFRAAIRDNERFRELYEAAMELRAHKARERIEAIAKEAPERFDAPGVRLQLAALQHLETKLPPSVRPEKVEGPDIVQAAVILLPPKVPPGLPAPLKALPSGDTDD